MYRGESYSSNRNDKANVCKSTLWFCRICKYCKISCSYSVGVEKKCQSRASVMRGSKCLLVWLCRHGRCIHDLTKIPEDAAVIALC